MGTMYTKGERSNQCSELSLDNYIYILTDLHIRYGVVANIIASHAIARGSIPRVGMFCRSDTLDWLSPMLLYTVLQRSRSTPASCPLICVGSSDTEAEERGLYVIARSETATSLRRNSTRALLDVNPAAPARAHLVQRPRSVVTAHAQTT
jgi:hypothetical protein